jgi:flagellar export protein FliJ
MGRFEFRLHRLLRLREQEKRLAELEYAAAAAKERAAQARLHRSQVQTAELSLQVANDTSGALAARWLLPLAENRSTLARNQALQTSEVLERQTNHLLEATLVEESLTSLRDRKLEEYRLETARADQHELDELIMQRTGRLFGAFSVRSDQGNPSPEGDE